MSKISCKIRKVAGKYGKRQDNMIIGRKFYDFTLNLASGMKYGKCQNNMTSGRKSITSDCRKKYDFLLNVASGRRIW